MLKKQVHKSQSAVSINKKLNRQLISYSKIWSTSCFHTPKLDLSVDSGIHIFILFVNAILWESIFRFLFITLCTPTTKTIWTIESCLADSSSLFLHYQMNLQSKHPPNLYQIIGSLHGVFKYAQIWAPRIIFWIPPFFYSRPVVCPTEIIGWAALTLSPLCPCCGSLSRFILSQGMSFSYVISWKVHSCAPCMICGAHISVQCECLILSMLWQCLDEEIVTWKPAPFMQ